MQRGPRGSGIPVDPLRVREARREAGLSLAQVAGDDVSRTFIYLVEQGRSRPSQPVLALIARRTGKPISYFLRPGSSESQPPSDLADEMNRLASRVHRLGSQRTLSSAEREAVRMIEGTLHHAAQVTRAIQRRTEKGSRKKTG